jgi:hypothetical protein
MAASMHDRQHNDIGLLRQEVNSKRKSSYERAPRVMVNDWIRQRLLQNELKRPKALRQEIRGLSQFIGVHTMKRHPRGLAPPLP